ncbi:MAG: sulfatase [Parvularcula sp.]|jgi:arylsulfatase A-like enzyme|nr:sulfatase [Parvularcula sp.]
MPKPPNLLYIFPDQFRRSALGFWDQPDFSGALPTPVDPVVTPTLDALARDSVVLTNATSTCPLCSPHRAMLMSGTFPGRNGVTSNCRQSRADGLRPDLTCLTDVIANAGYDTAYVGKVHWERTLPLFDTQGVYVGVTEPPGGRYINKFDTFVPPGPSRHSNAYWYQCIRSRHKDPLVYSNDSSRIGGQTDGEQHRPRRYSPELEADVVIDYLRNTAGQRDRGKPFSLIWSLNPPHSPYDSEEDCDEVAYRSHYQGLSPDELLNRDNVRGPEGEAAARRSAFYFANVTGVDRQIGRVLRELAILGEAENTIIVFTSDHGEMMGSHNRFNKGVIYEESFGVPFLIKHSRELRPRLDDLLINSTDIMPTLLGLLGLQDRIPETVQGRNFADLLRDSDAQRDSERPRSALFLSSDYERRGVRTHRYTFEVSDSGASRLFDDQEDPYQMQPLQRSDLPPDELKFLREELGNWLTSAGDAWAIQRRNEDLILYPE